MQNDTDGFASIRNSDGEVVAAFVVCDLPFVYLKEYFEFLPADRFSPIENRELLAALHTPKAEKPADRDLELMPDEAAQFVYGTDVDSLQKQRLSGNMPLPDPKIALYDISQHEAYAQYHLPGAVSVNFEDIIRDTAAFQK